MFPFLEIIRMLLEGNFSVCIWFSFLMKMYIHLHQFSLSIETLSYKG